jgi:hypothetical protein
MKDRIKVLRSVVSGWMVTTSGRWTTIIVILLFAFGLYPLMQSIMLNQSPTYIAVQGSNDSLAVNYIVALYLYGVFMDRVSKRIGQRKGWLLSMIGLIVILLALKYVFGWTMRW